MKAWDHFKTIIRHKRLVRKGCFAVGLYKQGILHDLSKFSPSEFVIGAKYYQGDQSPNNAERHHNGYSTAWLHHKGRNRHHHEYWVDYSIQKEPGSLIPVPMPEKYIVEMLMDRIAASKVYNRNAYTDDMPLQYYRKGTEHSLLHEKTKELLEKLLVMLADQGEKETFTYIRKEILNRKH